MNTEQTTSPAPKPGDKVIVERQHFDQLFQALARKGYEIIGPVLRDGAITYERVSSVNDLPAGWTDEQEGGKYRLRRRADEALFGFTIGPQAWKRWLFPPVQRLFTVRRVDGKNLQVMPEMPAPAKQAFLGVRACELHAMMIQDKVFLGRAVLDPAYQARRNNTLIVAINCRQAGGTCFCASMQCGPRAQSGFDLLLNELLENGPHRFLVEAGSQRGLEVLFEVQHAPATAADVDQVEKMISATTRQMGRLMDTRNLKELLYRNLNHARWEDAGARCLTCGKCTMVCQTCFCTAMQEAPEMAGHQTERQRVWDSCFTLAFSQMNGGFVRASNAARYRHWLVHKLAAWQDQYGSSGCVGCGRCITWCPVGIDLTDEVRAIRESEPLVARQRNKS